MREPGHRLGFFHELAQPVVILLARLPGENRHLGLAFPPGGQLPGQILLDRHPDIQDLVMGRIGDAETAVPQEAFNHVTVIQYGA